MDDLALGDTRATPPPDRPRAGDRARLVAVCISAAKGTAKQPAAEGRLETGHGLAGDAHAGPWHRQVSLLATASIDKMKAAGLAVEAGSFAENLTVDGIAVHLLPVGSRLRVGPEAVLEITQIGKECHDRCEIYAAAGDCVMPREGVFARVRRGGVVRPGDDVVVAGLGPAAAGGGRP